ncbi:MAG: Transcriptional regulator ArsR family [Verrucomicrobiaceae bacterium]|nr:Transcriptional regulator ArsR family [Verrucomicrobiaceae bacterium]MDB6117446.1 Transcriptional regulator ArsR family [Verrucomicrobiaceae bacterium]
MFVGLFKDIARPHAVDLIMLLKRSNGMSVNELAAALRMSYMGVKQHCVYLEKKGYVDTWRRPKEGGGRPEKMYRLTVKLDGFFPSASRDLLLDVLAGAEMTFGTGAAERLLLHHFELITGRYAEKIKGRTMLERAQSFSKLRAAEGSVSICEFDPHEGLRIVEYHSQMAVLGKLHICACDLEAKMVGRLLQCICERRDTSFDRVTRIEFRLKV